MRIFGSGMEKVNENPTALLLLSPILLLLSPPKRSVRVSVLLRPRKAEEEMRRNGTRITIISKPRHRDLLIRE